MSKAFCFTWNNYDDDSIESLRRYDKISYCIVGKEIGESGTPHLQGYFELKCQVKFTTLKILFPKIHFELRKGSQQTAIDYCEKGEQPHEEWKKYQKKGINFGLNADVTEWGIPAIDKRGKRTECDNARSQAKLGGMRLVTKKCQSFQAMRVASLYLTYNEEPRDYKPTVTWIYGKSGAGKSKLANKLAGTNDVYRKNDGTKWWNGYDGHENVILDDFRDSWWTLTEMLSLLDRYSKLVEVKGDMRQFRGRNIYITSINHPKSFYSNCSGEPIIQLLRRIDNIIDIETHPDAVPTEYDAIPDVDEVNQIDKDIERLLDNIAVN